MHRIAKHRMFASSTDAQLKSTRFPQNFVWQYVGGVGPSWLLSVLPDRTSIVRRRPAKRNLQNVQPRPEVEP